MDCGFRTRHPVPRTLDLIFRSAGPMQAALVGYGPTEGTRGSPAIVIWPVAAGAACPIFVQSVVAEGGGSQIR